MSLHFSPDFVFIIVLFLQWVLKTAKSSDPTKPGSASKFIINGDNDYLGNNSITICWE